MRRAARKDPGSGEHVVRAFFALDIPGEVKEVLTGELEGVRPFLEPARWVRLEGLHVTLKFLGESPQEALERLAGELRPRLGTMAPVEVRLSGSGFFPGRTRARVAWLGGEARGAAAVASAIDEAAGTAGWARERRPFSLHVTLARLRRPWSPRSVERWLEWGSGVSLAPFRCEEVILYESRLEREGARYTALERIALRGGGG